MFPILVSTNHIQIYGKIPHTQNIYHFKSNRLWKYILWIEKNTALTFWSWLMQTYTNLWATDFFLNTKNTFSQSYFSLVSVAFN